MKEIEEIDLVIDKYLQGDCPLDLIERLKAWVAMSSVNEHHFLRRQEAWFDRLSNCADTVFDKSKAWDLFRARVSRSQAAAREAKLEAPTYHYRWIGYAAAIFVCCLISYFCYWEGAQEVKQQFADVVIEAPEGSRTKLYLPDGTLVWLNAGSSMCYSQGFGVETRAVNLKGEAYFEVKRNEKIPFYVYTKELMLKVLGTKFNFRNYPEDDQVTVSLMEGKVSLVNLLKGEEEMFLNPNERAVLSKKTGEMKMESFKSSKGTHWSTGSLFFDERPLTSIVTELERSYNVTIKIDTPGLKTLHFYANFDRRNQSLNEVLQALAGTGKLRYRIEGNTVILY